MAATLETMEQKDAYLADFDRFEKLMAGRGHPWLRVIRKAGIAHFAELGFPNTCQEEWQHTNVAAIAKTAFQRPDSDVQNPAAGQIQPFTLADSCCSTLVFVNGRFRHTHSSLRAIPQAVTVGSLADAIEGGNLVVEAHLARYAKFDDQPFTALNTAFMEDGAFVHIPKGIVLEEPIHLLFVSTASDPPLISHPRNLIVAERDSQATIIETYAGIGGGVYFANPVTEIVANENAVIDHYKLERDSKEAFHIAALCIHQYRSSNVSSHAISLGGALVRNDIHTVLDGEGCDCTLSGLSMIDGTQHVDNHLRVDHAAPHCSSREQFKNILDDKSRSVFSGRIVVHQDAQKTDAKQANMNLILSDEAVADSKPQLEIFADDVKCTHGATVGQIDNDAVFYLRSRGMGEEAARGLLVYAFASESIGQVRVGPLRDQLVQLVLASLRQGHILGNILGQQ